MRSLTVETLSVRAFRNLESVDLRLGPRFNVLAGDNGHGKTNLLEALYVLATSRSFRTSRISDLVMLGADTASLRAQIYEDGSRREQSIGLRQGVRAVRVDGKNPPTLASYAVLTPLVAFHPGALTLTAGSGAERRKLLDRVALYLAPGSLAEGESYAKALRARQRSLELRGEQSPDLDGWEALLVRHGVALSEGRASAAELLRLSAKESFSRIGSPGLSLGVEYARSAPPSQEAFASELARSRTRDRARRSASVGPHRDDLTLELAGKPVRSMASQGQQRAVVLSLQLAEISVVRLARGVQPVLLMDDVSSELDRTTTAALFSALREDGGQILVTTTRPELVSSAGDGERRDFRALRGQILAA